MKQKAIAFNNLNKSFKLGKKKILLSRTKSNLSFIFCIYKLGFFTGLKVYKKIIKVSLKKFPSDKILLSKGFIFPCNKKQSYMKTKDFWQNEGVAYDLFIDTSLGLISKEDALRYNKGGFLRFTLY